MPRYILTGLICVLFVGGCRQQSPARLGSPPVARVENEPEEPLAGMGIMVGEVTPTSALAQVRLTKTDRLVDGANAAAAGDVPGADGVVIFFIAEAPGGAKKRDAGFVYPSVKATAERDFIARVQFIKLKPGTRYEVRTLIGKEILADTVENLQAGPTATFRTLPGPKQARPVRFVVVTGMNYAKFHGDNRIDRAIHRKHNNTDLPAPYAGPDKHLGYPTLASILRLRPHFFIGTGDNVYYDTPKEPRAETIDEMRQKWHEQFVQPRYRELFASVPTYWEVDDHDYRIDDGDNTGDYRPTPAEGRRILLEQLPYAPVENEEAAKTYRTHRVSRDLQLWFTENRMHRSPNEMPDGPGKSIWGGEQKAWLKRTLRESDATFKILVSPTPMIGPDDARKIDNHADIGGFQHERDEFFAWLKETGIGGRNFYLVCGDRHWQYHSIHPSGIEEFSCGALVDANSRPGRPPGDPESTDPEGLIRQVYAQETPSGGFLLIESLPAANETPATLTFQWHDEHGNLLHEHTKTAVLQ